MTLQQLDEVLKVWQSRLSAMAENLLTLQSDVNYRALTGDGAIGSVSLSGETAKQIGPAVGAMHGLFQDFGALQSTVDQAAALRQQLPAVFGGEAKAREIQRLLFSPSIALSGSEGDADSGWLGEAPRAGRCTPEQMLESMARRFRELKGSVELAGDAWAAFAKLAGETEAELGRLQGQRVLPTALLTPALDNVALSLDGARQMAESDPIGAIGRLRGETATALAREDGRLRAADQLLSELRAAAARLRELEAVVAARHAAAVEAKGLVAEGNNQPSEEGDHLLTGLEAWLDRLQSRFDEGQHEPLRVGLRNWLKALESRRREEELLLSGCRERIARHRELCGRLEALRARALVTGCRDQEDCHRLEAEAKRQCGDRPIQLLAAEQAIARYAEYLRRPPVGARQRSAPSQ